MVHFQNNGRIAIVFYGHSSAKIVGCRHGLRRDWLQSYIVTAERARTLHAGLDFAIEAGASPSGPRQPMRLPYSNFNRVKSCESTMPTGTLSSSMTTRSSM